MYYILLLFNGIWFRRNALITSWIIPAFVQGVITVTNTIAVRMRLFVLVVLINIWSRVVLEFFQIDRNPSFTTNLLRLLHFRLFWNRFFFVGKSIDEFSDESNRDENQVNRTEEWKDQNSANLENFLKSTGDAHFVIEIIVSWRTISERSKRLAPISDLIGTRLWLESASRSIRWPKDTWYVAVARSIGVVLGPRPRVFTSHNLWNYIA